MGKDGNPVVFFDINIGMFKVNSVGAFERMQSFDSLVSLRADLRFVTRMALSETGWSDRNRAVHGHRAKDCHEFPEGIAGGRWKGSLSTCGNVFRGIELQK